ncbi:exonuclease SbcCD subunit D [Ectobacillus antri]|jgi:exonuclease SbcD|uniref:Nuclease SbcCD subunit D n=1 Tax=Ectobacillus antri TaxID=2486280 RepID=A0ABT6H3V7_9BACI|nr:exonuclease SbcCD subunit D [Ectobacillus antri]MDG4656391.1 exonuclease SbcCD subunit D [Ectobacillus antri]MDG5753066.1 exonuclease SbcCD subunit D [Ectobacillus antri]
MKLFHTADWHLGKLIHGVYMTEEQRYILNQFVEAVEQEKPDAVIIAGDLYDRAIPPTEAVDLLNQTLKRIVIDLKTPVLAIAGNHDSPDRVHFGSELMRSQGLYIVGRLQYPHEPVVLKDEHGEVHFHLIPYADPGIVRGVLNNEDIRNHDDAMRMFLNHIHEQKNQNVRHVCVGHAFVTPMGEAKENTSESERPLAIGGAEHVNSSYFEEFHYTALGHLHQGHYVRSERIRYAGSPMKYSISEEKHNKGFYIVELDASGDVTLSKRELTPRRDMRTVKGTLDEILQHDRNEDYVFVQLHDATPVMQPMEKIRSVYPNAMHVERITQYTATINEVTVQKHKVDDITLLQAFFREMKGNELSEAQRQLFIQVLEEVNEEERM